MGERARWDAAVSRSLKAIAVCLAAIVVSLGLCGLDNHFYPHAEMAGSALGVIGGVVGMIAGLGLAGSVVTLLIAALMRRFRGAEEEDRDDAAG